MRWLTALLLMGVLAGPALAASEPPADPREHLQAILDEPAFTRWQRRQERAASAEQASAWSRRLEAWVEQTGKEIRAWIDDVLSQWRPSLPSWSAPSGGGGLAETLKLAAWGVVALLALLVVYVAVKLILEARAGPGTARLTREQIRDALETGEALAADSTDWLEEAQRLAEEKDLRLAFRAMYLALLSGLHRDRRIDFRRTRTNWVYVRQYRGPSGQRRVFADLTRRFDDMWYGLRQPERTTFDNLHGHVRTLLSGGGADDQ